MTTFAVESAGLRRGGRDILRVGSVWAEAGRITALIGRNGCGKSTLLRIAVGLRRADRGVVIFDGARLDAPRLAQLARRGLYFLPERGSVSGTFTGGQHLDAMVRRWTGDAAVAGELGLDGLLDRCVATYSGGERRRLEVALVFARRPRVLLADEPFLGIMPKDRDLVSAGLRRRAGAGAAVIVTGHEAAVLLALADDVVWMTAGRTHHLGSAADAQVHDQFRREYLGPGWTPVRPH